MNISKINKPFNGWFGQAMAEYHTLIPWMAIAIIIILPVLAGQISAGFQTVADCFEGAQAGNAAEACSDDDGTPGDEGSTGGDSGAEEGSSSTGSSSDGGSSTGSSSTGSSSSDGGSSTGSSSTGSSSGDGGSSTGSSSTGSSSGGGGSSTGSSSGGGSSTGSSDGGDGSEDEGGEEVIFDDETPDESGGTDEPFEPECGQVKSVIVEPRENNAQHIMVQYPVECDANGNPLATEPGAGTSNLRISIGSQSYVNAVLSGHLSGTFNAWCVDYEHPIYTNQLYTGDNYDDPAQSVDRPQNLPLINWLINYDWQGNGYEVMDVQGAIWLLIDSTPIKREDIGPRAEELAQLAIDMAGTGSTDPTINIEEEPTSVHLSAISGDSSPSSNGRWKANVYVTAMNDLNQPVSGVRVRVDFSVGGTNKYCTTNSSGQCTIQSGNISGSTSSVVATMDTIYNTGELDYDASQNVANSVTVNK